MADIQPADEGRGVVLLRLSALGFAACTGVVAFAYFYLSATFSSLSPLTKADVGMIFGVFTLPALPGALLSWWGVVVRPKQPNAFTGGCAGLLMVVLAVLGVCVAGIIYGHMLPNTTPYTFWEDVEATFYFWIYGLFFLCVAPWGWGILLVGTTLGALYGAVVHRAFLLHPRLPR